MVEPRLKACVEAYYKAFNARAEEAYLACFRTDGAVGGTLTGAPVSGVGVQKAILRTASGSMGDLTMNPVHLYQAQSEVAVDWVGEVRGLSGARASVRGIALLAFDEEAKIRSIRVYWNPRPLTGEGTDDASTVDSEHRRALTAYFASFNHRDWDHVARLFAEDCTFGGTIVGPSLRGEASLRASFESVVNRFREIRMHPLECFQAQNEVAVHWEGEVLGPDGALQPIKGISIFRFDGGGRIARYRVYWDPRPLLQES